MTQTVLDQTLVGLSREGTTVVLPWGSIPLSVSQHPHWRACHLRFRRIQPRQVIGFDIRVYAIGLGDTVPEGAIYLGDIVKSDKVHSIFWEGIE